MAAAYIKLYLKDLGEVRVIVNDKYLPGCIEKLLLEG